MENVQAQEKLVAIANEDHKEERTYYGEINIAGFIKSKWKLEKLASYLDEEMESELFLKAADGTEFKLDVASIDKTSWVDAEEL